VFDKIIFYKHSSAKYIHQQSPNPNGKCVTVFLLIRVQDTKSSLCLLIIKIYCIFFSVRWMLYLTKVPNTCGTYGWHLSNTCIFGIHSIRLIIKFLKFYLHNICSIRNEHPPPLIKIVLLKSKHSKFNQNLPLILNWRKFWSHFMIILHEIRHWPLKLFEIIWTHFTVCNSHIKNHSQMRKHTHK